MKRRKFLKNTGSATVLLSTASMLSFNFFPDQEGELNYEESQTALDNYFADIMSGKYFDPDQAMAGARGGLLIVKSYSLDVTKEKNSVFDISDLVIERLKNAGFDASLRNGRALPR